MFNNDFPAHNHRSTRQLIEGPLECTAHGTVDVNAYNHGSYYSITPEGYLHGYNSHDDCHRHQSPELSLYLPDCTLGGVDGANFTIKGDDVSGPKVAGKTPTACELTFRARNPADAKEWWSIILPAASGTITETAPPPEPSCPNDGENSSRSSPPQASGRAQQVAPATAELKRAASFSSPVCYECYKYD